MSVLFTAASPQVPKNICWIDGWVMDGDTAAAVLHTSRHVSFGSSPGTRPLSFLLPPAFSSLPQHLRNPFSILVLSSATNIPGHLWSCAATYRESCGTAERSPICAPLPLTQIPRSHRIFILTLFRTRNGGMKKHLARTWQSPR